MYICAVSSRTLPRLLITSMLYVGGTHGACSGYLRTPRSEPHSALYRACRPSWSAMGAVWRRTATCAGPSSRRHASKGGKTGETDTGAPRWGWAQLRKRVFALDMARCPCCPQGSRRIIAAITQGEVIRKILWYPLRSGPAPDYSGACPPRSLCLVLRLTARDGEWDPSPTAPNGEGPSPPSSHPPPGGHPSHGPGVGRVGRPASCPSPQRVPLLPVYRTPRHGSVRHAYKLLPSFSLHDRLV